MRLHRSVSHGKWERPRTAMVWFHMRNIDGFGTNSLALGSTAMGVIIIKLRAGPTCTFGARDIAHLPQWRVDVGCRLVMEVIVSS